MDESPLKELAYNGVYRLAPDRKLTLVTDELARPAGIAFSPDEKTLYVSNLSRQRRIWLAFEVHDGGVSEGRVLFDASSLEDQGFPNGIKVDTAGNIYTAGPGGVLILSPSGKHLGTIQLPHLASNMAWGDADARTLYITARSALYRVRLNIPGVRPPGN
jgi:gluconolactonase